jgi:hypothetical protein
MTTRAYVSVGRNCSAASFLLGQGLRTQSLLFDWARSPAEAVLSVLQGGLERYLRQIDHGQLLVEHPHRPGDLAYLERCARRMFDTIERADDLCLVCCSPTRIEGDDLMAVRNAVVLLRRRGLRVVGLWGRAGGTRGVVSRTEVAPGAAVYEVVADLPFETNRMHGEFYDRLAAEVFLEAKDGTVLYRSRVAVDDEDPVGTERRV